MVGLLFQRIQKIKITFMLSITYLPEHNYVPATAAGQFMINQVDK